MVPSRGTSVEQAVLHTKSLQSIQSRFFSRPARRSVAQTTRSIFFQGKVGGSSEPLGAPSISPIYDLPDDTSDEHCTVGRNKNPILQKPTINYKSAGRGNLADEEPSGYALRTTIAPLRVDLPCYRTQQDYRRKPSDDIGHVTQDSHQFNHRQAGNEPDRGSVPQRHARPPPAWRRSPKVKTIPNPLRNQLPPCHAVLRLAARLRNQGVSGAWHRGPATPKPRPSLSSHHRVHATFLL